MASLAYFILNLFYAYFCCVFPAADDDRPNDDVTAAGLWPRDPYSNCYDY